MSPPGRSAPDVEVEWQFDALDLRPVERWLTEVPQLAVTADSAAPGSPAPALSAEPLGSRRLVDAYLDTTDWRIGRSGFVLRVRRRAGGSEVTLKDNSPANGGLRRRIEVTEPLPAGGLDTLGTEGPVGRRLQALIGTRPLRQVLEVRTRRRPFALRLDGGQVAEVALDDTVIDVTDSSQPVRLRRVEVEVEPSSVDQLSAVVFQLRSECGLQPATLSKFEAGLLASGLRVPNGPELGTVDLPQSPLVGDIAFVVLRRNFRAMLDHEPGTRLGEDPEELHDMRVATRRLRAALAMFADALPVRARHVRDELGWLADALGAVRDLDVQLERVDQWAAEVDPRDRGALSDLSRLLDQRRDDSRKRLLACLESSRYERLVTSFAALLRQGPSRRLAQARAPAAVVVPDLVRARHRSVTKAAKRARRSALPEDFHRLRIRCKRLRYSLEFVSELYRGQTTRYVRSLVRLQDSLGLMQDARVAAERLHGLVLDEGPALSDVTVFVMGGVAERYRHEAAELADRVPKSMGSLTGGTWKQLIDHMDRRRMQATPVYGWGTQGVAASHRSSVSGDPAGTGHQGSAPASNGHAPNGPRDAAGHAPDDYAGPPPSPPAPPGPPAPPS